MAISPVRTAGPSDSGPTINAGSTRIVVAVAGTTTVDFGTSSEDVSGVVDVVETSVVDVIVFGSASPAGRASPGDPRLVSSHATAIMADARATITQIGVDRGSL